jgi:NADPH:quinone reductase-like Zn-dependent oxidoreductase
MREARIERFGGRERIEIAEAAPPVPGKGEVLVRVMAAGVGPWDAWIREGKSVIPQPLPLVFGSALAGGIEQVGAEVREFRPGDEIFGVTNPQFIGAYAEYAAASAPMVARKPARLSFVEAASVPMVAVTAWQMLFEYGRAAAGQTVLVHGAAGNFGAYPVQLARLCGIHVAATAAARDADFVRSLGVETVLDYRTARFEEALPGVDVALDMVGGEVRERSLRVLKPDGRVVSVVSPIPDNIAKRLGDRAVFFLVEVTTARLNALTGLFQKDALAPQVGTVLPLDGAQQAHEMLGGAPHVRGKIVLRMDAQRPWSDTVRPAQSES